jgi:hypothetical protein
MPDSSGRCGRRREAVQLGAARGGKQARLGAQQGGYGERVVAGRHQRGGPAQQIGVGAALVDGEVVDHGLHGERHGALQARLVSRMMAARRSSARGFTAGSKMKPMPPPDMPPSIQKPQKPAPISSRARRISVSV